MTAKTTTKRAFDLLEGLKDAWRKVDPAKGDDISAGFSRSTGGIDVEWLIEKLGPGHAARTPITSSADGDAEDAAWAWLADYSRARFGEEAEDHDFAPDQMVDAFMAGQEAALTAKLNLVEAVREFVRHGTRLTQRGDIIVHEVIEKPDRTDPHWKLCDALEKYDAALVSTPIERGEG